MKTAVLLTILALAFVSCSRIEEPFKNEVIEPTHPIMGKWKSKFSKNGPNFVLDFEETGLLKAENKICSECVEFHNFEIIDGNSVEFEYAKNPAGEMMIMTVTVVEDDKLKTQCRSKDRPDRGYIIDAPLMCMGDWKFQRVP